MQLRPKKQKKIGKFITQASMALVCTASVVPANADSGNEISEKGFFTRNLEGVQNWAKWSGEVGFLGYSETQGRVQAFEPAIKLNAEFKSGSVWSTKIVYDSLSGASPNGALLSKQPQTFTSPSGKEAYTISAGQLPLYSQFKDTRVNVLTTWTQSLSRLWKWSIGFNGSSEYDYRSLGLNSSLSKESEDKNSSWSVGVSYTDDTITPVGSIPVPLSTMGAPGATLRQGSSDTKQTYDILLGYSQVMTRSWIIQGNLSYGYSKGYMNDPYKIVTIHNDTSGPNLGDPQSYIYERRPDTRTKKSLFISSKNHFDIGVLTTAYRFLNDDWGLTSHTVDGSFNFALSDKWRLEPGFRYYKQTAVDFFNFSLGSSSAVPNFVTADTRLGALTATTPSIKIIKKLEDEKELSFILKYYQQIGDSSQASAVGSQRDQQLFPKLNAYIVQIHYSF